MATRDLTQDYVVLQGQRCACYPEDTVLHHAAVQVENPLWVKIMQNVRAMEVEAATELREMGVLIDERTRVGGSNRDFEAEERAVEVKQQRIVKIFARAAAEVKRLDITNGGENLDEGVKRELTDGGTQVELKLLRNASACLAQELEGLNSQVNFSVNRFLQVLDKQRMTRERVFFGGAKRLERLERDIQLERYVSQDLFHCHYPDPASLTPMRPTTQAYGELIEQNAELRRVLEGINARNEMFEDLHTMMIEQGTLLDRVDENMNQAHAQVGKVKIVISGPHPVPPRSFTPCVLILMIVMVIGLVLALMLKQHPAEISSS